MIARVLCAIALIHCTVAKGYFWQDGFEGNDLGGWNQTYVENGTSNGTQAKYVRVNNGSTGSSNTGPSQAYEGHNYIYYEDSGNDAPVSLDSVWLNYGYTANCSISYAIHMNGQTSESIRVSVYKQLWDRKLVYGSRTYQGHRGDYWRKEGFNFTHTVDVNAWFKVELIFNGSAGYQGDVALDALKLTCLDPASNPTQGPVTNATAKPTNGPVTNGTQAPYPTAGDGEVRVKFGGAQVNVNVPGFEAVEDLDEVAEGVFYMLHRIMLAPFELLHYLIHGY